MVPRTAFLKTAVYLDRSDYDSLKGLSRELGRPPAELIREAVAEYARSRRGGSLPRRLGAWRSGRDDLGERAEELLVGIGEREPAVIVVDTAAVDAPRCG